MQIGRLSLFAFASACSLFTASPVRAADTNPFASFPSSCATQAQEEHDALKKFDAKYPRHNGQGMLFFDVNSAAAMSAYNTFGTEGQLQGPAGALLYRGISNTTKPRISNKASREARRIGNAYDAAYSATSPHVDFGPLLASKTRDHYQCVTDTCPQGASCQTIDIKKEGEELLATLPVLRKHISKIFRWADSVKIFGSKVARLEKAYDRDEAEIKQLISGLPTTLVVVNVTTPIK